MREKPDFGTFDRKTTQFSELNELRFRRVLQAAVANKYSYSISFGRGSQVLFSHFWAFSLAIQTIKPLPPLIC